MRTTSLAKKKFLRVALLSALCAIIFYACKKNSASYQPEATIYEATKNVGKLHNGGLDYVALHLRTGLPLMQSLDGKGRSNGPIEEDDPQVPVVDISQVITDATNSVASSVEYAGITLTDPTALQNYLTTSYANVNETYIAAQWDTDFSDNRLTTLLTAREASLVDQIYDIFNNASSTTANINSIKSQLESLKSQNLSTNWAENEGEVFNGLLEIAISSAEYWSAASAPQPIGYFAGSNRIARGKLMNGPVVEGPSGELPVAPFAIIQADALGFLAGWASQAWSDYHSPQGLRASGQKVRIGQGLIWAIAGSTGGLIKGAAVLPDEPEPEPEPPLVPIDTIP